MKLILQDTNEPEITVTIQGNLASEQVQAVISMLKATSVSNKMIAYDAEKELFIGIGEVQYFSAEARKVYAVLSEKKYLVRYTLTELARLFRGQGIVQISKSMLINTHKVKSLEAEFSGNYVITLTGGTKLIASRLYMKEFRKAIMEG